MKKYKTLFFNTSIVLILLLFLGIIFVFITSCAMKSSMSKNVFDVDDLENLQENYDFIVVLGAGLKSDGTPSDMLADRVTTGVGLYDKKYSDFIIMSGDRSAGYNEPDAMATFAHDLGVDSENILMDYEGYSTYESIYRAKKVFKAEKILIVSQGYHLYRALFIAKSMGLQADGVASDPRVYSGQGYREFREILARVKDFYKVRRCN